MQVLKMRKNCRLFWYGIAAIMLVMSLCEGKQFPANVTFEGIFAFGDSIVDQGNNNVLSTLVKCDFLPYGKDFNAYGTPTATGRFCNGKTPPDLLAEALGIKELVPAYLDPKLNPKDVPTGVSFASGGSGYDPQTPQIVRAIAMSDQLRHFKEYIRKLKGAVGEESGNKILSNSLFLVVAGSNDLANTYFTVQIRRMQYNISTYADLLVSSASTFIQEIYNLGARKIGVFSLPPIGCMPAQRTLAGGLRRRCAQKHNEAAQLVNSKLSPALDSLTKSLPQSRVVYIDVYNPLLDLIQNPQNYGFEVSDKGCCGTGDIEVVILCNRLTKTCANDTKYIFWDSFHPTERAYKILVDQILPTHLNSFR